jgi:hypothetical protein
MMGSLRVKIKLMDCKGGAAELLNMPARQAVGTVLHSRAAVRRILAAAGLDHEWPEDSGDPVYVLVYQLPSAPAEV